MAGVLVVLAEGKREMRTSLASEVFMHIICENGKDNEFQVEKGNTDRPQCGTPKALT